MLKSKKLVSVVIGALLYTFNSAKMDWMHRGLAGLKILSREKVYQGYMLRGKFSGVGATEKAMLQRMYC